MCELLRDLDGDFIAKERLVKDFLGFLSVVVGLCKDLDGLKGEFGYIKKSGEEGLDGQSLILVVCNGSPTGDSFQDFAPLGEGSEIVLRHG